MVSWAPTACMSVCVCVSIQLTFGLLKSRAKYCSRELRKGCYFYAKHVHTIIKFPRFCHLIFVSLRFLLALRLAEGHGARLLEFEQFESQLKKCLSSAAIRTKFEKHHQRGTEVVHKLEELLKSEDEEIATKRYESLERDIGEREKVREEWRREKRKRDEWRREWRRERRTQTKVDCVNLFFFSHMIRGNIKSSRERSGYLSIEGARIERISKTKLNDAVRQGEQLVQVVMADVSTNLTSMISFSSPLSLALPLPPSLPPSPSPSLHHTCECCLLYM